LAFVAVRHLAEVDANRYPSSDACERHRPVHLSHFDHDDLFFNRALDFGAGFPLHFRAGAGLRTRRPLLQDQIQDGLR